MKFFKILLVFIVLMMVVQPAMAEENDAYGTNDTDETTAENKNGSMEGDLFNVFYFVTFLQSDARKELDYINDFRMGSDNWCWNKDNTEKVYMQNPHELEYDYELERVAMQRCAEIAFYYNHIRPDGSIFNSAFIEGGYQWYGIYAGENIAWGNGMLTKSADAFKVWREDNEKYSGQGHRRNMLNENYNRVGVAGCKVGSFYLWVQEFAYSDVENSPTPANDEKTLVSARVYESELSAAIKFKDGIKSISLKGNQKVDLPQFTLTGKHLFDYLGRQLNLVNPMSVYIEDENIAYIDEDNRIVGVSTGTTNLVFEGLGISSTIKINVSGVVWPIDYVGMDGIKNDNPVYYDEGKGLILKNPKKAGYEFGGFYLDDSFTDKIESIDPTAKGGLTLYAKWTPIVYSISYDAGGGSLVGDNPSTYTVEDEIALIEPRKDDMIFAGWYDQTGKLFTGIDYDDPKDLQLTAYYRYDAYYSIIYNLNGGINSENNPDTISDGGVSLKLSAPTRIGYTFGGWYVNPDFSGRATTSITTPGQEGSFIVLNAKWKENTYKLSYNKNSGTLLKGVKLPSSKYLSTQDNVVTDIEPYRVGYHFEGWSRDKTLSETSDIYHAGDDITGINGDLKDKATVTLFATWSLVDYNLTLNYQGGNIIKGDYVGDGIVHIIDKIKLPVLAKDNYKFKGFYNEMGKKVSTVSKTSRDTHLSAMFVPINYRITYVLNGGKISSLKGTYSTSINVEGNLILPEVYKDGADFESWCLSYDKQTGEYSHPVSSLDDLLPLSGSIKLYAKWN